MTLSATMILSATMRGIWEHNRADVLDQVAVIEDAVSYALEENLDAELRTTAAREAHKIFGSVGTLGFVLAGEHARELERALSGPEPPAAEELPRLAQLVSALRNELEAPMPDESEAVTTPAPESSGARVEEIELLVIDTDAERSGQIVAEAANRGVPAWSVPSLASAREMLGRSAPRVVLLDLSVSDPLERVLSFLGEIARDRPVLVVTDPARSVDRVEVARRGGRGLLPSSLSSDQRVDAVITIRERVRTRGTRILALDDDPTVFALLKDVLGRVEMAVSTCDDSSRFLAVLEEVSPDLVILDFNMPGITGPVLCRAIRNDQRWEGLPIVFVTGRTDADAVRDVFDAGADDYVSKPFVGPELVARISNRLERVRVYGALAEADPLSVTIGGGLAECPHDSQSVDSPYDAADRALSAAKDEGRNRVAAPRSGSSPGSAPQSVSP